MMTRLNLKCSRSSRLLFAIAAVMPLAIAGSLRAQKVSKVDEKKTPAERLTDADIEWDSLGWHGGPRLVGENAIRVFRGTVRQTPELMKKLDDEESFVAAHVLLTDLWRVHFKRKNTFSHGLSDGFFVCLNGLYVQIKWEDDDGKVKKTAIISDLDCQKKRLREFWKTRLKEHPEEFLPETKIEEK